MTIKEAALKNKKNIVKTIKAEYCRCDEKDCIILKLSKKFSPLHPDCYAMYVRIHEAFGKEAKGVKRCADIYINILKLLNNGNRI